MTIKAIEQKYKGYRFRSRLEARWAVFFDALGIKWEYELQGYVLPGGTCYLPDFWLPGFDNPAKGMFVEVKPAHGDVEKAAALALASGVDVLMAVGAPSARVYEVFTVPGEFCGDSYLACFTDKYLPGGTHASEYRLYVEPCYEKQDGSIDDEEMKFNPRVVSAINAARGARFEFGESGARA